MKNCVKKREFIVRGGVTDYLVKGTKWQLFSDGTQFFVHICGACVCKWSFLFGERRVKWHKH